MKKRGYLHKKDLGKIGVNNCFLTKINILYYDKACEELKKNLYGEFWTSNSGPIDGQWQIIFPIIILHKYL